MKGLLVIQSQTASPDTYLHARLDLTEITGGPGLDLGQDQEGPEQVRLIPDQRDPEANEDHVLKGHIITTQIGEHTGVLHAATEDVLVPALTEPATVPTQRTTTGRLGRGQVIPVDRPPIQAR